MAGLVIGLQMYTLRDYCQTEKDIINTIKKVREIGYRTIQVSAMGSILATNLRKILDDNGIYPCSTHTSYQRIINDTDKVIEDHRVLGCEAIMCPCLPVELRNERGYLEASDNFNNVLPKIRKNGLILGYHNHAFEFEKYNDKTGLEILLGSCPGIEAEIDTYWVQYAGANPSDLLKKYSGIVSEVHFKDIGFSNDKHIMPPIGEGNLNWRDIISTCKKSGTKYCLVEIDSPTIDPFEAIRISYGNLKHFFQLCI